MIKKKTRRSFARKEFVMGNLQRKREIFSALGQNFYIKDGKVFITANEWLQPIKEAYPEFRAEFERLGLREYASTEARNVAYATLILEWGAVVEHIRKILRKLSTQQFIFQLLVQVTPYLLSLYNKTLNPYRFLLSYAQCRIA